MALVGGVAFAIRGVSGSNLDRHLWRISFVRAVLQKRARWSPPEPMLHIVVAFAVDSDSWGDLDINIVTNWTAFKISMS